MIYRLIIYMYIYIYIYVHIYIYDMFYIVSPKDLSPKLGLSFESIPNGLAALTKVPGRPAMEMVMFPLGNGHIMWDII